MNDYYQKINWNYDKELLLNLVTEVNHIGMINLPFQYVRKIKNTLKLFIHPFSILYFNIEENGVGTIHIDYLNNISDWALNLPLTENFATMHWYTQNKKDVEFYNTSDNFAASPRLNQENAIQIASCQISQPLIVKINYWHNVTNQTKDFTKFISLRFLKITSDEFLSRQKIIKF
jgi:hypothetical protein